MWSTTWRKWVIRWLYGMGFLHLLGGLLVTWGDAKWFAAYNTQVFAALDLAGSAELQIWWLSIFGATLQAFAILFIGLVHLGNKFKLQNVWLSLILAILVWAPQDIYFSAIKNVWINVWADLLALVSLLPALIFCYWCDARVVTKGINAIADTP
jgi:hypothetical protein